MPSYDMQCATCKLVTERNCKHSELETVEIKTCDACKTPTMERVYLSGPVAHFRGSGFYATDYQKKKR